MKKSGWCWLIICLGGAFQGAAGQAIFRKPVTLLPEKKATYVMPVVPPVYPVYLVAPNFYYQQHFGFFCKQEWNWQKQTGIPVKLRLGNYAYTQQLEGKK
ncbi:hypothetical protein [Chitinophaga nivalis]|uniref:Uncharacterized protein n=1 Tax=Chitinophaga nivalis TaxID=2991709 RepID=A0ABT3IV89_9BACT|nr:hypothetical protein [Chitinophaga nivalis]MCW3462434.1 hypothetical protein [Chitinophaga nivalis]MCW3487875.1 hypothetical protein [Chitinophaga nivalis]